MSKWWPQALHPAWHLLGQVRSGSRVEGFRMGMGRNKRVLCYFLIPILDLLVMHRVKQLTQIQVALFSRLGY